MVCGSFLVTFAGCLTALLSYVCILFACPLAQDEVSPVDISLPHDRTRPSTITRYPGNCLHPSSALHSQERPFRCVYFIRLTGPVSVGRRHESYSSPQHIVVSRNEKWSNISHSRRIYIYIYIHTHTYNPIGVDLRMPPRIPGQFLSDQKDSKYEEQSLYPTAYFASKINRCISTQYI